MHMVGVRFHWRRNKLLQPLDFVLESILWWSADVLHGFLICRDDETILFPALDDDLLLAFPEVSHLDRHFPITGVIKQHSINVVNFVQDDFVLRSHNVMSSNSYLQMFGI